MDSYFFEVGGASPRPMGSNNCFTKIINYPLITGDQFVNNSQGKYELGFFGLFFFVCLFVFLSCCVNVLNNRRREQEAFMFNITKTLNTNRVRYRVKVMHYGIHSSIQCK